MLKENVEIDSITTLKKVNLNLKKGFILSKKQ